MNFKETELMVFRRDYEGKSFYSIGLSKKQENGYLNGYMPCSFKKGVDVQNKTKIKATNMWLTFYLKEKETKPYIFINEFEILDKADYKITTNEGKVIAEVNHDELKTSEIDLQDELPF